MNFSSLKNVKPKQRDFFLVCIGFLFATFAMVMFFVLRTSQFFDTDPSFFPGIFSQSLRKKTQAMLPPNGSVVSGLTVISGRIVEMKMRGDTGAWIKLSAPMPPDDSLQEEPPVSQKEKNFPVFVSKIYTFFLSKKNTEGVNNVHGGEKVAVYFHGQPSETDFVLVDRVERVSP